MWSLLFCLVGITWVMPHSILALLESWRGTVGTCRSWEVWGVVPACLFWCIWRVRNHHTFEGVELSLLNIKFIFLRTLYDWFPNTSSFSMNSFINFVDAFVCYPIKPCFCIFSLFCFLRIFVVLSRFSFVVYLFLFLNKFLLFTKKNLSHSKPKIA